MTAASFATTALRWSGLAVVHLLRGPSARLPDAADLSDDQRRDVGLVDGRPPRRRDPWRD